MWQESFSVEQQCSSRQYVVAETAQIALRHFRDTSVVVLRCFHARNLVELLVPSTSFVVRDSAIQRAVYSQHLQSTRYSTRKARLAPHVATQLMQGVRPWVQRPTTDKFLADTEDAARDGTCWIQPRGRESTTENPNTCSCRMNEIIIFSTVVGSRSDRI